ncbi:MAG: nucleotidyltransferase family protein [Alphaproteobacteria bacterium]|nr:nucleotidyltransferase family protein [Alphaproteobacteria bacterium]
MICVGLLLAAGASRRFGAADKLLAQLQGRPLVAHAAEALRRAPLHRRIAVISNAALAPHLAGFDLVQIAQGQQSDSLRAGLAAAGTPDRLLVALGDMPDVTADHLAQVLDAADDDLPSASHDGNAALPPACFPAGLLPALAALRGDQGAGRLLRDLPPTHLVQAPILLRDIDLPVQI